MVCGRRGEGTPYGQMCSENYVWHHLFSTFSMHRQSVNLEEEAVVWNILSLHIGVLDLLLRSALQDATITQALRKAHPCSKALQCWCLEACCWFCPWSPMFKIIHLLSCWSDMKMMLGCMGNPRGEAGPLVLWSNCRNSPWGPRAKSGSCICHMKSNTKHSGWERMRKKATSGKRIFRPVISDVQEAKTGRAKVQGLPGLQS